MRFFLFREDTDGLRFTALATFTGCRVHTHVRTAILPKGEANDRQSAEIEAALKYRVACRCGCRQDDIEAVPAPAGLTFEDWMLNPSAPDPA